MDHLALHILISTHFFNRKHQSARLSANTTSFSYPHVRATSFGTYGYGDSVLQTLNQVPHAAIIKRNHKKGKNKISKTVKIIFLCVSEIGK